jgi:16S rRNA (cytosine967-C5)-methyltransferase
MPASSRHESARESHIVRLWQSLQKETPLPQLDRWLRLYFRANKNYGKRDRLEYSEALFSAMRFLHFAYLAAAQEQGKFSACLIQQPLPWEVLRTLKASDLRRLSLWRQGQNTPPAWLLALENPYLRACVWHSIPSAYAEALAVRIARTPDFAWEKFLQQQDHRPPLWLRANHGSEKAFLSLQAEGFKVSVEDFEIFGQKAQALRLDDQKSLQESQAFQSGFIEIQDLASQAIALSLSPKKGDMLWDACAGGGGKTLHLASLLGNSGAVYASDIREYKAEARRLRARRAQFWNVRDLAWAGEGQPTPPREIAKRQGFDGVLVDAPCSASGTWRRNPDAKYRFDYPNDLPKLTALQQQLLGEASQSVRPGGRLAYATCSWLVEENEGIAEAFSTTHPDFTLQKMQLLGNPWQDSDTMFVAVWQRRP